MSIVPGPICLNCEKKKITPYPITLDQKSGFICEECYNAHIWANKSGISTKIEKELVLYSMPTDTSEKNRDNLNLNPKLKLV